MKIAFRMASPNPVLDALGEAFAPTPKATKAPVPAPEPEPEPEPEAEAEAAPAPTEEEPKKKKKERQIPIPKDSASFFRVRAKNLKMFQFTKDGDLQVPEMRGEPAKVIQIPYYRPATAEETLEDEQKAMEQIQEVEREFDETYKILKAAIAEWRSTGFSADVIKYQNDLQRLDSQRTQLRSPLRWTKVFKNLSVNKILLNEFYEQRKLGYYVQALKTRTQTFEQSIRADGFTKPQAPETKADSDGEADADVKEEEFVIFSSPTDPEHGSLSPYTMVEFIHNSTKYNCVLQAYEGERLSMLGRQDVRPTLLKSRSVAQMRVIGSRVVGQPENPREVMIAILKSLISQHSRFADDLRATGTATLVFAEPKDGVLGVGMGIADEQITEKTAWKGTNFLGQAWTAVRAGLPPVADADADTEAEVPAQTGGYTEHGTTLKEAKEKRANVLKGFYRRKF